MSRATMNSRERFLAAMNREEVDRPSVGNPTSVATVDSMNISGCFFPEVHQNPDKMAALAAIGHDVLGFDTVSPYFSVQQESAAFGCPVVWGGIDSMPENHGPIYGEPADVEIPDDFLNRQPIRTVLEAIRLLRQRYGDTCAIVGKAMGPWTLAYHLYGTQNFLIDTIREPDKVSAFLDVLKEVTILFANEQFAWGADVVTIADHATGDLVGPNTYRDYLLPVHKVISQQLNGPAILHICGNTLDRMQYIAESGFTNFHFDSKVNALAAKAEVSGRISLSGNLNNVEVLLRGTPHLVEEEVRKLIEAGIEIIGPECAVPLRVSNGNLRAILDSVVKWS